MMGAAVRCLVVWTPLALRFSLSSLFARSSLPTSSGLDSAVRAADWSGGSRRERAAADRFLAKSEERKSGAARPIGVTL